MTQIHVRVDMSFAFSKEIHDLAEDINRKHGLDEMVLDSVRSNNRALTQRTLFQLPFPTDKVSWKDLDKVRTENGPTSLVELVLFMNKCGKLRSLISKEINAYVASL